MGNKKLSVPVQMPFLDSQLAWERDHAAAVSQ